MIHGQQIGIGGIGANKVDDMQNLGRLARAEADLKARIEGERAKALEKYGEVALAATGHPDYDIDDYLINEVVGIIRYAEMKLARLELMYQTNTIPRWIYRHGVEIASDLRLHAQRQAVQLLMNRSDMLDRGLMLGAPEQRR